MYCKSMCMYMCVCVGEGSEGEWEDVEEEVVIGGDVETPMEQDSHHQQVINIPLLVYAILMNSNSLQGIVPDREGFSIVPSIIMS